MPPSSAGARSGAADAAQDAEHFSAAREGLGEDAILLVDTGQIFIDDVERAAARLPALEQARATWFEEPFAASALASYGALAARSKHVKLAGGEGAHNVYMAKHLIDYGGVGFIQIDCGRIGGIGPSKEVADYAVAKGVTFVNHTFTSHLALSASMQPFAGLADHRICEFPAMPKPLGAGDERKPPDARRKRRDRRAGRARVGHGGFGRGRAEISSGDRYPGERPSAFLDAEDLISFA